MQIKTVSFGKTFNDGSYESTRIDFSAEVDPGDDEMAAFEDLIDLVYEARKKQILATKGD